MIDKKLPNENYKEFEEQEINLIFLLNSIIRNKKFIGIISIISLLSFFTIRSLRPKKWSGQFEIVMKEQKNNLDKSLSNSLANVSPIPIKLKNDSNSMETEVGILTSSSILMPLFEFVNDEIEKIDPKNKYTNFIKWKNRNLDVVLKRKTSILQVSYEDKNKDLILPVLQKMGVMYKNYSEISKKKDLKITKKYLIEQIEKYKIKSSESLKRAQEFGMNQDLTLVDINPGNNFGNSVIAQFSDFDTSQFDSSNSQSINPNVGIESLRVKASNKIKKLDVLIKKFQELEDPDEIRFLALSLRNTGTKMPEDLANIESIESQLVDLRSRYKESDIFIQNMLLQKKLSIDSLKEKTISFLKAQKVDAESIKESAVRPKGVLLKYKEIIREAERDENTLINLENELRLLELQVSKITAPWELITSPYLDDDYIGLSSKKTGLLGLVFGFIVSSIYVFIKENNSNIVFEEEILKDLTGSVILEKINLSNKNLSINNIDVFKNEIINFNENKKIKFIRSKSVNKSDYKNLINIICEDQKEIDLFDDFTSLENLDKVILITKLGESNKEEYLNLLNRLNLKQVKLFGIIILLDNYEK